MHPGGSRRFYTLIGLTMAVLVIIGFSRTFYLRPLFDVAPLTLRLHLHGIVLTLWVVLSLPSSVLSSRSARHTVSDRRLIRRSCCSR